MRGFCKIVTGNHDNGNKYFQVQLYGLVKFWPKEPNAYWMLVGEVGIMPFFDLKFRRSITLRKEIENYFTKSFQLCGF